jgi:hypothetical protein
VEFVGAQLVARLLCDVKIARWLCIAKPLTHQKTMGKWLVKSGSYGSLPAATIRLNRMLGDIQTTRSSKVGVGVWLT